MGNVDMEALSQIEESIVAAEMQITLQTKRRYSTRVQLSVAKVILWAMEELLKELYRHMIFSFRQTAHRLRVRT